MKTKVRVACAFVALIACASLARAQETTSFSEDEMLERLITATGSKIAQQQVMSVKWKGTNSARVDGESRIGAVTSIMKRPNKGYMSIETDKGSFEVRCDGRRVVHVTNPGSKDAIVTEFSGDQLAKWIENFEFDSWGMFRELGYKMVVSKRVKEEGIDVYPLRVTRPSGQEIDYYVDAEKFLILKQKKSGRTTWLSDYRVVSGLLLPFLARTTWGDNFETVQIESYEFNPEFSDDIFTR